MKTISDHRLNKLKTDLIAIQQIVDDIIHQEVDNPFLPGDWVEINRDIQDDYGEIWHSKGNRLCVKSIAKDGEGLFFSSNLGIHWTHVKRGEGGGGD